VLSSCLRSRWGRRSRRKRPGPARLRTWYIDGDEVLGNGTFHLNGDFIVNGSGSLTIKNATLVFDDQHFVISCFGRLHISDSILVGADLPYPWGRINVAGTGADISNSTFDNISIGAQRGQCRISGCTFTGQNAFIASYTNTLPTSRSLPIARSWTRGTSA